MGQAKARGSYEERKQAAIKKDEDEGCHHEENMNALIEYSKRVYEENKGKEVK